MAGSPVQVAANEPCFDFDARGTGRPFADATLCFASHHILGDEEVNALAGMGLGRVHVESEVVVRPLADTVGGSAVAFLGAAQACILLVGEGAREKYRGDDWWFLGILNAPVREYLRDHGRGDCLVEIQSVGDLDFAVVDLLRERPLDDVPDGMLALHRSGATRAVRIQYLPRTAWGGRFRGTGAGTLDARYKVSGEWRRLRWTNERFGRLLARYLRLGTELLRLSEKGFVMEEADDSRTAVVFRTGFDPPAIELRVCSREELNGRSGGGAAFEELLKLSDRDIAIRGLPGEWHETTSIDASAYVFCDRI